MDVTKVSTVNIQIPGMNSIHKLDYIPGQKRVAIGGIYQNFLAPFPRANGDFQMSLNGTPYLSKDGKNFVPATSQVNRVLVKLPNRFLANTVGKAMHKFPVWVTSMTLSIAGTVWALQPIFGNHEFNLKTYLNQNPIDAEKVFEHEVGAEFHLLMTTPLDRIPVQKRPVWELLGNVEPLYKQMNAIKDRNSPEATKLYKEYLAEAYQVVFEMAQKNNQITPSQRDFQQSALFAVGDFPQPKPIIKREFPNITELSFVNQAISAPAADASRDEFVKYYATKYNIDL